MESVQVKIEGDADTGYTIVPLVPVKPEKAALYIGPKKNTWLLDYDSALSVIDTYAKQCRVSQMGKSDYVIIYPAESAVKIDDMDYVMGECIIMKAEKDVTCMTQKETIKAFTEYASRVKTVYAGQYGLPAYQLD